jgi:hypothetical protein
MLHRMGVIKASMSALWNAIGLIQAGRRLVTAAGLLAPLVPEPESERTVLSLPVMTALPVVGGINVIVQAFLRSSLCEA